MQRKTPEEVAIIEYVNAIGSAGDPGEEAEGGQLMMVTLVAREREEANRP
jgi:hypothetical protein